MPLNAPSPEQVRRAKSGRKAQLHSDPKAHYKNSQVRTPTWRDTLKEYWDSTIHCLFKCLNPIESFLEKHVDVRKLYAIFSIVFFGAALTFFLIGVAGPTSTKTSLQTTIEGRFYRGDVPTADAIDESSNKLDLEGWSIGISFFAHRDIKVISLLVSYSELPGCFN